MNETLNFNNELDIPNKQIKFYKDNKLYGSLDFKHLMFMNVLNSLTKYLKVSNHTKHSENIANAIPYLDKAYKELTRGMNVHSNTTKHITHEHV